tara:strand:- start:411 stop:653 length:243 start_codon:yes stop_codon:yes gene_type:complete
MPTVLQSWDEAKPGATANLEAARKAAQGPIRRGRPKLERDNQAEEVVEEVVEEVAEESTEDDSDADAPAEQEESSEDDSE